MITREEIVNSREYKIAGAALNDISSIDEEYASNEDYIGGYVDGFENGAEWADEHPQNLWHDAQGNDLPEIDREVIVLQENGRVCFGHRPKEYWDGKNIATDEVTRYYPKRYDKGGWNIPDVKWWLDVEIPNWELAMTEEEIKEAIEDLDDEVLLTIIECCKELSIKGMQMCFWDRDAIMDVIDKVLEEQR